MKLNKKKSFESFGEGFSEEELEYIREQNKIRILLRDYKKI